MARNNINVSGSASSAYRTPHDLEIGQIVLKRSGNNLGLYQKLSTGAMVYLADGSVSFDPLLFEELPHGYTVKILVD